MNKHIFLTIFTLAQFVNIIAKAQDLIVTTDRDSLNCKITKQSDGFVYFNISKNNILRNTYIDTTKVISIAQGYYDRPALLADSSKNNYSRLRLGFHAGYSLRIPLTNSTSGANNMQKGFMAGVDMHGFVSRSVGLGLKYNMNKYGGKKGINLKGGNAIHYIAASILRRDINADQKSHFLMGVNIGTQLYREEGYGFQYDMDIKGKSLGFGMEAGYEHRITAHSLFHLGLSLTAGTIKQVSVNGNAQKLSKENYKSLTRMDLTAGIKFGR